MFCVIRKIVFIFAAGNDKSHITMSEINQTINLHVSVDCVLIGFDGEQFRVLLVRQVGKQSEDGYNNMKLPGSLIYDDEDLDEAAKRVLNELTGLKNVKLTQFKAYGSKDRTRNLRMCCGWNVFIVWTRRNRPHCDYRLPDTGED